MRVVKLNNLGELFSQFTMDDLAHVEQFIFQEIDSLALQYHVESESQNVILKTGLEFGEAGGADAMRANVTMMYKF